MTNSQTSMLKEKSVVEYHSIAATLSKDIAVLHSRRADTYAVASLLDGYIQYYRRYNIRISVADMSALEYAGTDSADMEISFIQQERNHFIRIAGMLPEHSRHYRLDYRLDITKNIADMQSIQNTLLLFAIAFSVLTAIALYFILLYIFKPFSIIADASKKIADGQYSERLQVKGENEVASMALSFNRMAEEIEKQIRILADEAVGKQQFVDNLAHEIRTPLTSIYGYAEYMQKVSLDEGGLLNRHRISWTKPVT
jgi:signal transduction histidine kinase